MKILHAADLHLDSPLLGLSRYEGAPAERLRNATRQAFDALVDLALEERVALLLLAGDIYDGDWKDHNTGLYFAKGMSRLREGGVQVVMISGNHDAQGRLTQHLRLPANVVRLSADAPQTHELLCDGVPVAVHGQSYPRPAVLENLAAGYPAALPGVLNLGLLHTCLDGREGHQPYAPCKLGDLQEKGYDYWALGHVHAYGVLASGPPVVFSGCLQGRNVRETGAHGAVLLEVQHGEVLAPRFVPLDVLRWDVWDCALRADEAADEVLARAEVELRDRATQAEGRLLALRVRLSGTTRGHGALLEGQQQLETDLRALATDCGDLWLEQLRIETRPPRRDALTETGSDALASLLRGMASLPEDPQRMAALRDSLQDLRAKLRAELSPDLPGLSPHEPLPPELIEAAQELLLARLHDLEADR